MALVPETGAGLSTADTYVDLTDAGTYFTNHGAPAAWTAASTSAKEGALRTAATWLDARYEWPGLVLVSTQALAWPLDRDVTTDRGQIFESGTIPVCLKAAQCEAALIHLSSPLNVSLDRGGLVKRKKLGPIETEFMDGAPGGRSFSYIDSLLSVLAVGGGGSGVTFSRKVRR